MTNLNLMGRGVLHVRHLLSGTTRLRIAYSVVQVEFIVTRELIVYVQILTHSSMVNLVYNVITQNTLISRP